MALLNDFKLLNAKCESYFNILEMELDRKLTLKKDSDRARYGFYLFILENIISIKEFPILVDSIIDTDFNVALNGAAENDEGMDAVYIDEEENRINLFNFKFRENFKQDSKHSKNDVFISTKFLNALLQEKTDHLKGVVKEKADDILEKLYSNDIWKMKLFIVSNESNNIDLNDGTLTQLQEIFDLEIIPISLPDITDFLSLRPLSLEAKIVLDKESILSYTESSLTTTKSYIVKMSIPELLRITCNSKVNRDNHNMEDYSALSSSKMDYHILFDNVRGYLGNTKFNQNIFETLKNEPYRFFMYNNGITITTNNIEATAINANKKIKFDLKDLQVVNGGQTLRTLHEFYAMNNSNLESHLSESEILVRIFKTGNDPQLTSKIAEYTNSQNSISPIDLKSIAYEQIQIEQYFDAYKVIYARKSGDTGLTDTTAYVHKLSMEKFAQILYAKLGYPQKVSNQKKRLFDKFYNEIFGEGNFKLENSMEIFQSYLDIKNEYEKSIFDSSDQKIFYIIYLREHLEGSIADLIDKLENNLNSFRSGENIASARKLIQLGFKDALDDALGI